MVKKILVSAVCVVVLTLGCQDDGSRNISELVEDPCGSKTWEEACYYLSEHSDFSCSWWGGNCMNTSKHSGGGA